MNGITKNRIGESNTNKWNERATIIEYENNKNIIIEFDNGYKKKGQYYNFKKGSFKSPYTKTVFNKGYLGEGRYNFSDKNGNRTKCEIEWRLIFQRCYYEADLKRFPSYRDCSICEDWHNFQNFAEWFEENYYKVNDEHMVLDKDILIKNNKIYSPNTCIFVPERINILFTKTNSKRGLYPIGVSFDKYANKYSSQCSILVNGIKKQKKIGRFNTPEEAFNAYKEFKEQYIKQVADEYKDKIPKKLYEAMYKYKVEITD